MTSPARTDTASAVDRPRKVLFSAMKNEAPFVLEWIAYHKVIGFDDIVICSNPSNDGMEEILAALAEAGEIRHLKVTVPEGNSPQFLAAEAFEAGVGYRAGDWYLWLDADEFLNVHVADRTIDALISTIGGKCFGMINWRIFGAGGQPVFRGRFISTDFVGASEPSFRSNLEQKTMFRHSESVLGFGKEGLHRPQLSGSPQISLDEVLVGNGATALHGSRRHQRWVRGDDFGRNSAVEPQDFGWSLAQINHYIVRTPEYFALKRMRGRGFKADSAGTANLRHTDEFFREHDRNEAEDRSILHWEAQVTREMARLRQIPAVDEAARRSESLVQAVLAGSEAASAPKLVGKPVTSAAAAPTPPAAAAATFAPPSFELTFPRDEAALVKEMYAKASVILEYGSGGSTLLAAKLGKTIISVESDKAWADALSARLAGAGDTAKVHHVSIGPTEKWGFPTRPRFHLLYHLYPLSVWDRPDLGEPDLVLIDGRFRAACLAAVRMRAKRSTTVLFDDYEDRPYYAGVERLAQKEATVGRMARFTVTPGPIPPEMLTEVVGWFSDPR